MPSGSSVRPTSDKVKQALFNILGSKVDDAFFLDLFAGAGGIGIEALSRGAKHVVFVDASKGSISAVRENMDQMGFSDNAETIQAKAESYLKKPSGLFDIVFLDPPYADELQPLLERVAGAGILKPGAIVIAEHFKKQPSPKQAGSLSLYRETQYGDTVLAFYAMP